MAQDLILWQETNGNINAIGASEYGRKLIGEDILAVEDIASFLDNLPAKIVVAMLDEHSKNLIFLEQSDLH